MIRCVLAASADESALAAIGGSLESGCRLDTVRGMPEVLEALGRKQYDALFIDVGLLRPEGVERGTELMRQGLQSLRKAGPGMPVIVLAAQERIRAAVEAVQAGADNYLTYPVVSEEVRYVADSMYAMQRMESELNYLRDSFWSYDASGIVKTESRLMQMVFDKVKAVAPTSALVLLSGETGTGKSVIARLIHNHSTRKSLQYISVHCGAIPDTLIESELFGHEKGAFTGAVRKKLGKFELAHGGTIFLDEIGTITPAVQVKLLQILQERTFQRLGGEAVLKSDARVIAATNMDLKAMAEAGEFRQDLFYRLNVFPLEIPPLRDRREDIPMLVAAFLERLQREYIKDVREVSPQVMEALSRYSWPGNVRELENLIERAFILETSHILQPESFPADIFAYDAPAASIPLDTSMTLAEFRNRAKEDAERQYLKELLTQTGGRINKSAQQAGITTRQLRKLLIKYSIRKEDYRQ